MVISRSDSKRRRKEDVAPVNVGQEESPKRAKVHAQRKFAQGSASLNSSPAHTPVKDVAKTSDIAPPPKFIPSNRPKTEDFLTFLCFRGTSTLPPRLDFFNVATVQDNLGDEQEPLSCMDPNRESSRNSRGVGSLSAGGSNRRARTSDRARARQPIPAGSTKKNVTSNSAPKKKTDLAVQALMKKYQDQRLAKSRTITLSKLALKVKGKNMVRTRSAAQEESVPEVMPTVAAKRDTKKKCVTRTVVIHSKQFPRLLSTSKNKRGGLRSGGQLAPGSSAGLKTDRSPRRRPSASPPKQERKSGNKPFISSLSDFSSDDDQPLLNKTRINDKMIAQRGRNIAQKVKKRYAKQRPNTKLRPQIMTRSQQQMNALKEIKERERKENIAKERVLKRLKDIEAREKSIVKKTKSKEEPQKGKERKEMVKKYEQIRKENKEKIKVKVKQKIKAAKNSKDQKEIEKREMILKEVKEKEREMKEREEKSEKELREKERKMKSTTKEIKVPNVESSLSSRPSRKTKEAAAFYMEMLGKRLTDLGEDDDDDFLSIDSFPELPNARRNEQREKEIKAQAKENYWGPCNIKNKTKTVSLPKSALEGKNVNKNSGSKIGEKVSSLVPSGSTHERKSCEEKIPTTNLVVQDDENAKEKLSPTLRRRSLRTGSFHLPGDFSESKSKTKVSVASTVKTANSIQLSESFSDSDEEPLDKLALRSKKGSLTHSDTNTITKPRKSREVPAGGMKDALRESITHPPPMPKRVNDKSAVAKAVKDLGKDFHEKSQSQCSKKLQDMQIESVGDAQVVEANANKVEVKSMLVTLSDIKTFGIKDSVTKEISDPSKIERLVHLDNTIAVSNNATTLTEGKPNQSVSDVINEQIGNDVGTPRLEVRLEKLSDQRNPKSKVNMSTEQIEKWLSESCSRDLHQSVLNAPLPNPSDALETELQASLTSNSMHKAKKSNQEISKVYIDSKPKLKIRSQCTRGPASIDPKPVRARREVRAPSLNNVADYQQSLNRAIAESIKDNANFIRKKNAEQILAVPSSKDVSPISNLSISTISLSDLGGSLTCGLRTSHSIDDLRNDRHYPERTPEKKSIFQRSRHSPIKGKQRKDLKPSSNAFSPENERSVYAFDSEFELPLTSQPFRRQTTRDSRTSSVATSRSEEDLSRLGEEEGSQLLQVPRLPHTFSKSAQVSQKTNSYNVSSKEKNDAYFPEGKSFEPSQGEECMQLPVTNVDPPTEVIELNTSNTTSNSDEELARVRDRLLGCQPPTALPLSSSTSIAVQVNLDSEDETVPITDESFFNQSLECSTQTEVDDDEDDDNGHLFYIPLQPGAAGAHRTASGMIQGVAVKLGTEGPTGPNQRVIMRAKLVTKPPKFNKAASARIQEDANRPLLNQSSHRPVMALPPVLKHSSTNCRTFPPIGTVQPTSRTTTPLPLLAQSHSLQNLQKVAVPKKSVHVSTDRPVHVLNSISTLKKTTITSTNVNVSSASVNPSTDSKQKTVYYSYHATSRTMYVQPPDKPTMQSKIPSLQRIGQDMPSSSGAIPGSVTWALPRSVNAPRKQALDSDYYSQTSDKVVVAKKEAFISAVPPLAPLSYPTKKATSTIVSAPIGKPKSVTVPSQVQSTHQVTTIEENVSAAKSTLEETPKDKSPATTAPEEVTPGPSGLSKNGSGMKRGPKLGWRKANLERALETCQLINKNKFPTPGSSGQIVEAPTFHPTESEFQDPIEYIERIRPIAEKFGLCRIVPPAKFKPECMVSDDMRFTAYNQYVHKTLHRWGPNVKELMAIRKYLATQNIILKQPPYIGSIEIDLPRLYQTVQSLGGLKEVILKARWHKVADEMRISKSSQDRATKLDDIYCKYLLPYETLSPAERELLMDSVEMSWQERERKKSEGTATVRDISEDDDSSDESDDADECIVKGRNMPLNQFYRTARNTMNMWFKQPEPSASVVETEFWKHVTTRQKHVCVLSGSIESSRWGYGFPVLKNSPCAKHAWNLKVLTNNSGSVLRSIGPIMGVTVPTLHVGMLFTTCCWYRDPHGLPWIEYLHTGANKIWYGIPDEFSSLFRTALEKLVPRYVKDKTIWLPSDTAMVPPPMLAEQGVSLSRTVQEPGQFIVVFPRAFTSSICSGYLVSESVYYAQPRWLATSEQVFKDVRDSCEPSMFSLERLLFCIATDTRSSVNVLKQVLPMIKRIIAKELDFRKQLSCVGLKAAERLDLPETAAKKRKSAVLDSEYECEICRANLYVSLVTNSHEEGVYCLPHALEHLSKQHHHLKYCKLQYTYDQAELDSLVEKLEQLIEVKSQKKSHGKLSL